MGMFKVKSKHPENLFHTHIFFYFSIDLSSLSRYTEQNIKFCSVCKICLNERA